MTTHLVWAAARVREWRLECDASAVAEMSVRRAMAVLGMSMTLATAAACSSSEPPSVEGTPERTVAPFSGPSGLERESEETARAVVAEQQRLAAEAEAARIAAEAAAAESARLAAVAEAARQERLRAAEAAEEAAAAAQRESAERADDEYVGGDLEFRCSEGTATVEECFGPGSDLNGNGVADINEEPPNSGQTQYEYLCDPDSPAYAPEYC